MKSDFINKWSPHLVDKSGDGEEDKLLRVKRAVRLQKKNLCMQQQNKKHSNDPSKIKVLLKDEGIPPKFHLVEYVTCKAFYTHHMLSIQSVDEDKVDESSSSIKGTIKSRREQRKEEDKMKRKLRAEEIKRKNQASVEVASAKKVKAEAAQNYSKAMMSKTRLEHLKLAQDILPKSTCNQCVMETMNDLFPTIAEKEKQIESDTSLDIAERSNEDNSSAEIDAEDDLDNNDEVVVDLEDE